MTRRSREGATLARSATACRSRWHAAFHHGLPALALATLALTAPGVAAAGAQDAGAAGTSFVTHVIDGELASGYQPVVADLNRDGRPDVIGLSTRIGELPGTRTRVGSVTCWPPA